ncbi:MAG: ribonuclease HII [Magnetococcales bacterium]|nr:ribonuclease HII [Magnetococcales bacterium]MBF0114404.1 ribonuclease HII [Magnetococcales bacterium]
MAGKGALPTFELEQTLYLQGYASVCGVDEVGRGPLAGPVVAAAVLLPFWQWQTVPTALAGVTDSKQLSAEQRRHFVAVIQLLALKIGIGTASPAEIDDLNIRRATLLAMERAVAPLHLSARACVLVDGRDLPPGLPCPAQAIVRGDQTSLSIAAASIIAKEHRDAHMTQLARTYPGYGWEHNSGYPTAAHRQALRTLGVTAQHRRSYSPVRAAMGTPINHEPSLFNT